MKQKYVHVIDAILMQSGQRKAEFSNLEKRGQDEKGLTLEERERQLVYESGVFFFPQLSEYPE